MTLSKVMVRGIPAFRLTVYLGTRRFTRTLPQGLTAAQAEEERAKAEQALLQGAFKVAAPASDEAMIELSRKAGALREEVVADRARVGQARWHAPPALEAKLRDWVGQARELGVGPRRMATLLGGTVHTATLSALSKGRGAATESPPDTAESLREAIAALDTDGKMRRYTDELKGRVLAWIRTSGMHVKAACAQIGVSPQSVRDWRLASRTPEVGPPVREGDRRVSVTLPGGAKIEGLTPAEALDIMRALKDTPTR